MTVGIAVSGPRAARSALAALQAIEAVGRGAIGGFVSLVAIEAGRLVDASVQRGGAKALFGAGLPEGLDAAPLVALMTSGPDRPEPLLQFTPGDPAVGLLTGHRLPNMPGPEGVPPNLVALDAMRAGASCEAAVAKALDPAPTADAGLIAMDLAGTIALGNSALVALRDDIGSALAEDPATGLRIGILHNSIYPHRALADLAVAAAIDAARPEDAYTGEARLIGRSVTLSDRRGLDLGPDGDVVAILVEDPVWLGHDWEGSVVLRGDAVTRGGRVVGRVVREVYCRVENGRIVAGRGGGVTTWWEDD